MQLGWGALGWGEGGQGVPGPEPGALRVPEPDLSARGVPARGHRSPGLENERPWNRAWWEVGRGRRRRPGGA